MCAILQTLYRLVEVSQFNNQDDNLKVTRVDRAGVRPFVSVILPMLHNAGRMMHATESWVNQSYPQDRFEIVVVSKKDRSDMEMDVRAKLRSHDTVIFDPTVHYYKAMNSGARAAKGDILFFAESHVTAQSDCIAEMVDYLEANPHLSGAATEVRGDNVGLMSDIQQEMYAEVDVPHLKDPNHWRTLATRGFSLLRSTYVAHGPFEDDYGLFSERAVSIRFKQRGLQFGFCTNALIGHYDVDTFKVLETMTLNYMRGECAYREEHPEEVCNEFLGTPALWQNRLALEKGIGKLRAQALIKAFLRSAFDVKTWLSAPNTLIRLIKHLHISFFGLNLMLALATLELASVRITLNGLQFISRSLYGVLFRYYWLFSLERKYRLVWLSMNSLEGRTLPITTRQNLFPLAQLESRQFAGFHMAEQHNGFKFRWSEPECVLYLFVEKSDATRTLTLQLLPGYVSIDDCRRIVALLDGVELEQITAAADGRVEFNIPASLVKESKMHFLSFAAQAKQFPGDPRCLSLPVVSVEVPLAQEVSTIESVVTERRELLPV